MTARPGLGALLFLAVLALDQATKAVILATLAGPVEVTGFFNLVLVWNRGVSFGMLSAYDQPWVLIALAVVIGVVLVVWLRREPRPLPRAAIWLVLAGALGNVIDRVRFGAVADFLDFHAGGWHWPAFNVADAAICIGAALLVLDGLLGSKVTDGRAAQNSSTGKAP